jgi:hypothetical protein
MNFVSGADNPRGIASSTRCRDNGNPSMKYADGVTHVQVGDRIRLENGEEATVTDFAAIVVRTDRGAIVQKNDGFMEKIVFVRRAGPSR